MFKFRNINLRMDSCKAIQGHLSPLLFHPVANTVSPRQHLYDTTLNLAKAQWQPKLDEFNGYALFST